jgi:ribosomal protein S18 acetylase RimI-like enzyme
MPLFQAQASDLPAVVALVNGAYRGDGARRGWTTEASYLEGQRTSVELLQRDLDANSDATLFTLRDAPDAELLGCVWLEPAGSEAWYVGMLTVRPDLQDRQLGRTLLEAAETLAMERGARRMRMTVINVRDTLIAWYERRGYGLTGETQPFPYGDDRFGTPLRPDLFFVVLEKALGAMAETPTA